MRGRRRPTAAKAEMMVEARGRLVEVCEEFSLMDMFWMMPSVIMLHMQIVLFGSQQLTGSIGLSKLLRFSVLIMLKNLI
ncbi:hypothetical protein Hdeb2414_s0002g00049551 [Helianthus debilis subsp. tardiflorus]